MMCEEDEIWEYDNNGITYFDFCNIYNEALSTLDEYGDYDSDEEWDED